MYDLLDVLYFANTEKSPRTAINRIISVSEASILDLCCGTMSTSLPIARKHPNARITGVDLSPEMLQVAHRKLEKSGHTNIRLKCADATATSLSTESFDYVILGLVLHEMAPELQSRVLAEAHRLLKKDGALIVLEWERPSGVWQRIKYAPLYAAEQMLCKTFRDFYSCDKTDYFSQKGFDVVEKYHCSYTTVMCMKKR